MAQTNPTIPYRMLSAIDSVHQVINLRKIQLANLINMKKSEKLLYKYLNKSGP